MSWSNEKELSLGVNNIDWNSLKKKRDYGPFGNVVLVTLFVFFEKIRAGKKMYKNTCNVV